MPVVCSVSCLQVSRQLAVALNCCPCLFYMSFCELLKIFRLLSSENMLQQIQHRESFFLMWPRGSIRKRLDSPTWDPSLQEFTAAQAPRATCTILHSFILMQTDTRMERWCIYYPHLSATNPAQFHAFRTNSRQWATGRGSISQYPMPNSVS